MGGDCHKKLEWCVHDGYTPMAMKKTLEKLPKELEPFYQRIVGDLLARFNSPDPERDSDSDTLVQEARRMLTWATFAERPLTIGEFRDAIAIPDVTPGQLLF